MTAIIKALEAIRNKNCLSDYTVIPLIVSMALPLGFMGGRRRDGSTQIDNLYPYGRTD